MTLLATLILWAWIPLVLLLFAVLPVRRAVVVAFLTAWLFLPVMGFEFEGLPEYTKMSATCAGVLLGVVAFGRGDLLLSLRPSWVDLPIVVWCVVPVATSLSNGLGLYDGLSSGLEHIIGWGVPYLIGRAVLSTPQGLKELAIGIFIGGLIYMPLCLWEIRMSPQLNSLVYGYYQAPFSMAKRLGGFRPMVFMHHGLMLAMFMASASLVGVWLWYSGTLKRLLRVPVLVVLPLLLLTTVLCKSLNAIGVLAIGLAALFATRLLRTRLPLILVIAASPIFVGLRVTGAYSGEGLVKLASTLASEERAQSLGFRLEQEQVVAERAWKRSLLGWGGYNRAYRSIEEGKATPDSLWIIAFGENGLVGLAAVVGMMLLPAVRVFWRVPVRAMARPQLGPVVALAMIGPVYMIDNLFNAMTNPVFMLALGACAGVPIATAARRPAPAGVARGRAGPAGQPA